MRAISVETIARGRYRVEDTLGHGGMAVVYVAEDAELARRVAVKVLAEQFATDDEFRRRFVREARLAARLSHPNVVHVYDAGVGSSFAAASVARTWKVWLPSASAA